MFVLCAVKWAKNAQFAFFYYQYMSFQQIAAYIKHDCHFDSPYIEFYVFLILMSIAKVNHKSTEAFFCVRPLIFIIKNQMWLKFAVFSPTTVTFGHFFSNHSLHVSSILFLSSSHTHIFIHSLRIYVCVFFPLSFTMINVIN